MTRGFQTFTDAGKALSLVAAGDWQLGELTIDDGSGMVVADGDPDEFHRHDLALTVSGATFLASPTLPARLGITDARGNWFVPLMDWIVSEIGFFDGASNEYGGGESWLRDSDLDGQEYRGIARLWKECGVAGRTLRDVAIIPADGSFVAYLWLAYLPSEQEIADSIMSTFEVDGAALAAPGASISSANGYAIS
jgi:hypothetical protein